MRRKGAKNARRMRTKNCSARVTCDPVEVVEMAMMVTLARYSFLYISSPLPPTLNSDYFIFDTPSSAHIWKMRCMYTYINSIWYTIVYETPRITEYQWLGYTLGVLRRAKNRIIANPCATFSSIELYALGALLVAATTQMKNGYSKFLHRRS